MSPSGHPSSHRRTPDKPAIEGFLAPRDVGRLRPSDSLAPGAFEAIRRGCTCDRLANDYGRGASNGFLAEARRSIVDERCPLHGSSIPSVPVAPRRCAHCGEDLELAKDGTSIGCPKQCDTLVVGPPEPAPRVRRQRARNQDGGGRPDPAPAICDRCQEPIMREPGQLGRAKKHHDHCRTPAEVVRLEQMREWNERERQKTAQGGGA